MVTEGVLEQRWVPVQVDRLEEVREAVQIDPKAAIVERFRLERIVVQLLDQGRRPVLGVRLTELAFPPLVPPWIFQKEKYVALWEINWLVEKFLLIGI